MNEGSKQTRDIRSKINLNQTGFSMIHHAYDRPNIQNYVLIISCDQFGLAEINGSLGIGTLDILGSLVLFVMRGFSRPNYPKLGHIGLFGEESYGASFEINRFWKTPHDEENKTAENT